MSSESEGETTEESEEYSSGEDESEEEPESEELTPEELAALTDKIANTALPPLPGMVSTEKTVTIQPVTVEEVVAKLSPKPQKKLVKKAPVQVKTKVVEKKVPKALVKKGKKGETLDSLLKKSDEETEEFFVMRSAYSRVAEKLFPKENSATFVLIGQYGANRGTYGLTYSEEIENLLNYVDSQIQLV